jgi:lipopolysaccharide/colanic/teichoic acid biosynthesis glycosyltransferase
VPETPTQFRLRLAPTSGVSEDAHLALPLHVAIAVRPTTLAWAVTQRLVAFAGCVLLSPLLLVMFVLVKTTSRGPFLFSQERPGYRGARFRLLKVRTMEPGSEVRTALGTSITDPQITRAGRVLRELKLDELPQLWNVVRGDMELVGPRPLPSELDRELRANIPGFELRYEVKPGLTNVSQVAVLDNKLGPRLVEDWRIRFEGELHYIKNKSFAYDLVVLAMTVLFVFRKLSSRDFQRAKIAG